ncbi:MAG: 6-phosphofructokinase [Oscillospiraceae bacterium]
MFNIAVAQSGGPTAAINSSLVGVFTEGFKHEQIKEIYGFKNGIEGIISDDFIDLKERIRSVSDVNLLKHTPSTALGSCRMKLPPISDNSQIYEKIFSNFERHNIGAFFYIGGNDSMDTVAKLSKYAQINGKNINFVGIPKTIDNDLVLTDHTPGFGSAAKYIATTVNEIICDSQVYALNSVTIIEIMGRDAGWLTASSCVLRANGEIAPHLIYLPETPFSIDKFILDVQKVQKEHKAVIVAVSEGLKTADGNYVASGVLSGNTDVFGHKYLAGLGKFLENLIKEKIGCKVRSVELNVMQRCSSHIASKTDIDEAEEIGSEAVKAALNGSTGVMMSFKRVSDFPYEVVFQTVPVDKVANAERCFPQEWINEEKNGITSDALNYFLPLITGEVETLYKNGIPVHFEF